MIILNLIAAAIVLVRGIIALNHMCQRTRIHFRATWLLLTVSSAAVLLACNVPTWTDLALHCGIAALLCIGPRGLSACTTGDIE